MAVSKNTIVITSKGPKGESVDSTNTTYLLDTGAGASNDATITLTGSDATTDSVTIAGGTNVTITESGDTITIAAAGGGASVPVYDDGTLITSAVASLNFAGSGVVLTEPTENNVTVTVAGAATSFGSVTAGGTVVSPNFDGDTLNLATAGTSAIALSGNDVADTVTINAYLENETAPTLGAQLDLSTYSIYTTNTNGDIIIYGDGTGVVSLGSNTVNNNVNLSPGLVDVRNDGTDQSKVKLYCENESHYVQLKAPAHSGTFVSYDLVLPETAGTSGQFLQTDGSGNTTWADGGSATALDGQHLEYIVSSSALASAGDYEGLVMKVGDAGNTLVDGTVYYFDASQNDWVAADNSAEGTAKGVLGIALGASGTSDGVLVNGIYYYADGAGTSGDVLFLGTSGAMTATAPTTDGEILRVLGQNINDNLVMFQPSQDFVELGAAAGTTGLNDLSDVTITTPSNGEILIYDSGSSVFENTTLTSGNDFLRITNSAGGITIGAGAGEEVSYVVQSAAVANDGEVEGSIVKFGTTTGMTPGAVHVWNGTNWVEVDADAEATTKGLMGVALGASSANDGLLTHGVAYLSHDPGAAGDVLYVHTTAGELSATQPSATGDFVRVAGYCLADNKVFFSPSQDFIEIG